MLELKNKAERELFARDYKTWGVWKSVPELGLLFYRYDFANGAALVVTEYDYYSAYKKEYSTLYNFCLILPEDDTYPERADAFVLEYYRTYTPDGCSLGTVVDYMTKSRDAI